MWLSISGLFFSLLALLCCVWVYFQQLGKLSKGDLKAKLAESSEELSKSYARSVKEMEMEWANMYEKLAKLAGRMDRKKALENPQVETPAQGEQKTMTRNDLIRGRKK